MLSGFFANYPELVVNAFQGKITNLMFRFGCTVPHMRIPLASVLLLAAVICGAGIGWRVYKGKAYERKRAEAASLVRARAEEGDAKAQHDLAGMYYYGKGVPQDYAEAVRWYRKAARPG